MTYDFLIFDLDGTLSDPKEGILRSINYSLAFHRYPDMPEEDLGDCLGPPIDRSFARITGSNSAEEVSSLVGKFRERYASIGYAENVLYPGIPQALRALADSGTRLGVCTSKRRDFAEKILTMFSIRSYFQFVNGGDVGIDKWQQIDAMLQKGIITTNSVMIGDRDINLIAAHRNGLASAGVLWGYGSAAELEKEIPRYLLSVPSDLLTICTNTNQGFAAPPNRCVQ